MANSYTLMCEQYDLTPEQVKWFEVFLADCQRYADGEDEDLDPDAPEGERFLGLIDPNGNDDDLDMMAEAAAGYFEVEGSELIVSDDGENADIDVITAVLSGMLEETQDTRILQGTWAGTCEAPRPGEFGGGWFCISATVIRGGNVWSAAVEMAAQMK